MKAAKAAMPILDPSKIPQEAAELLARETLAMVRRMKAIPKYRAAMEAYGQARLAREKGGRT